MTPRRAPCPSVSAAAHGFALDPRLGRTVLPRATTSLRERAQPNANTPCASRAEHVAQDRNDETAAIARKRRGRLDKLGVTGSSPIPPIVTRTAPWTRPTDESTVPAEEAFVAAVRKEVAHAALHVDLRLQVGGVGRACQEPGEPRRDGRPDSGGGRLQAPRALVRVRRGGRLRADRGAGQ